MTDQTKPVVPMTELHFFRPPARSVLICGGSLRVECAKPVPNWWWRMWLWLLLGWQWRPL